MQKNSVPKMVCVVLLFLSAAVVALPAQTLTTIYDFCSQSGCTDGSSPTSSLIQSSDGSLYGTTWRGGGFAGGTVFKISTQGALTTLYSFCPQQNCSDGAQPNSGLVQGNDGNFYGTTSNGEGFGGTVFKITSQGLLTTLYRFRGAEGVYPEAGLVQASDGNFYGTTSSGGTGNAGAVFKITPNGALTTLHSFLGTDGLSPDGPLVQASDGNFYGTTFGGGGGFNSGGTVFKITPTGALTTLYSFCGCADGGNSQAGLVQASDGNFYGTTSGDGANNGGTIFKITSDGKLTTIYTFCSQTGCTDGLHPFVGLIQATDGKFYGTTSYGGSGGAGTIFQVTPGGEFTTLHSFNQTDGYGPRGPLVQAADGSFYGVTIEGGLNNAGTVFHLDVGLGTSVSISPASLDFGTQGVHNVNTPQSITLTNTGMAPLLITGIDITGTNGGDFYQWNSCPMSPNMLAPGEHCAITVAFTPTETGVLHADVAITDIGAGPQIVPLTGVAVGGKVKLR
jgi:uncharacterized repeat protein (TIGR03803 family)